MTKVALAIILGLTIASGCRVVLEEMITILHKNDIHGHVTPWRGWEDELAERTIGRMDHLATARKAVCAGQGANVLPLVDGDAIGDMMIAEEPRAALFWRSIL